MIDTPLVHGEKPLRAREQTNNNSTHIWLQQQEPRSHWWEACAQRCSRVRLPHFGKYWPSNWNSNDWNRAVDHNGKIVTNHSRPSCLTRLVFITSDDIVRQDTLKNRGNLNLFWQTWKPRKVFSIVIKLMVQNYIKSGAFLLNNKEFRGVHPSPPSPPPPPQPPPTTTRKDNALRAWQNRRAFCMRMRESAERQ